MANILGIFGNLSLDDVNFIKNLIVNKYDNFININTLNIDECILQLKNTNFVINFNYKNFKLYQPLLDILKIPYNGCNLSSSILSTNYPKFKEILRFNNFPTPPIIF